MKYCIVTDKMSFELNKKELVRFFPILKLLEIPFKVYEKIKIN